MKESTRSTAPPNDSAVGSSSSHTANFSEPLYQMPQAPPPSYEQATGTAQPPPHRLYAGSTTNTYGSTMPNNGETPLVIIQQQAIVPVPLGPEPVGLTCPACHIYKLTRIEYEPSVRTHLMAALFCLVGLWCCFCLPYCAGSCMNVNHYCGNCNKFLGSYSGAM